MAPPLSLEALLADAQADEKRYEWMNAASEYKQAVETVLESGELLRAAKLQERVGYCFHRAAFQANTRDEFVDRLRSAIEVYEAAEAAYARLEDGSPWVHRCSATVNYLRHWLAATPSEKGVLMRDWLGKQEEALEGFWSRGEMLEFAKTYAQPQHAFEFFHDWAGDPGVLRTGLEKGIKWGEKAVEALSGLDAKAELAACYHSLVVCLGRLRNTFIERPDEIAGFRGRTQEGIRKQLMLAKEIDDAYLASRACAESWWQAVASPEQRVEYRRNALTYAQKTQDLLLTNHAYMLFASAGFYEARATDDPDEAMKKLEDARRWVEKVEPMCSILSTYGHRTGGEIHWPPWGYVWYYLLRGGLETDLDMKRDLLDEALDIAGRNLQQARSRWGELSDTRIPWIYGVALSMRSRLEPEAADRKTVLQNAFTLIRDSRGSRRGYIGHAEYLDGLADVKAELAALEKNSEKEAELLEEAIAYKGRALESYALMDVMPAGLDVYRYPISASHYSEHARLLLRLYSLKKEPIHLERAIPVLEKGIEVAQKTGLVSRAAECYWQLGTIHDALGDLATAGASFQQASQAYLEASQRIPQIKDLYSDYAGYMSAWSTIEQAKRSHNQKRYEEAAQSFDKSAQLLKSTVRWNRLSLNYSAWAQLEKAEGLSRKEDSEEARDAFKQGADLFAEAKRDILINKAETQLGEEQRNAEELAKASDMRREYCLARAVLEDAKVSAGQGNYTSSSEKYGVAADKLEKLMDQADLDSERRELKPIVTLCRAWERMMQAEGRSSPTLYGEASEVFEQVARDAADAQTSLLAQANSYMCKALEAGTRFEATKDPEIFSTAKKHLEAATNQYLRAGFRTESEYPKAMSRLLDAYFYMYQAQVQTDLAKRAQSYQIAENMLQTSAGSYVKGRHPAKAEEVQRVLESVREEREIAQSLSGILSVPTMASATNGFVAPTQSHEQAVGLARFEESEVLANLLPRQQEIELGQNASLEIELVNAGRFPAQLIKVEGIIPEGFEIIEKPTMYRVEDSYLDMKGKNLIPLKTEEVRMVLRPVMKGTHQLKPRILYVDNSGKYKSYEPEPATISVKELGISGWLKGPRREK